MKRRDFPSLAMRGLILALLCAVAQNGAAAPAPPATLRAIAVSPSGSASQLRLRIDGDYTYKTLLATPDTLFIDLTGAKADQIAKNGEWSGGLLTGYRLVQFIDAAHQPVVRVHVEMKHHEAYQVERLADGLVVTFGDHTPTASAAAEPMEPAPARPAPADTASVPEKSTPSKPSSGPAEVSALFVSAGPDGEVHVDVDTSKPTNYRVLRLENPRRLVVDLDGARKAFHQSAFSVPSPLASGVRIGQFQASNPAVVRVVVDLAGDPVFNVHARSGGVRIELKARMAASHPAPPAVSASMLPASKAEGAKLVKEVVQPKHSESSSATTGQQTAAPPEPAKVNTGAAEVQPVSIAKADYQNTLPAGKGAQEAVAAPSPRPAEPAPEAVAAAHAAKVIADSMPAKVETSPNDVPGAQAASAAPAAEQPHYSGEPISLNLKDVDLKDFFRLIHEISGLNIMIDPNVTGTVTMVLDNVPWDQALDIVLKDNSLGKSLEGNVLRISKLETLTAEQEVVTKLTAAREEAQPVVTRFIPVSYAKAGDIVTLLKTVAGGGALSKRGTAVVDARTNTVIVTDTAAQIPVVSAFIEKLDTKSKQVSIEARIIVATKHFERDLFSALNYGTVNPSGSTVTGGATGTGASAQGNIPTASSSATTPRVTLGQTNVSGFGAFVINNQASRYFINAMISAAETKADAKTISNPMIITQNNVQGTVLQGVQIPIQTSINLTVTVQMVNAALQLQVTPQVTADGNVFLNIKVDNSTVGTLLTTAGPSINTQNATTQVLVPDGGTVVFGGITVKSENKTANYVPWIGDIPILGHLFKNTTRISDDNELLFFVTPKILPG